MKTKSLSLFAILTIVLTCSTTQAQTPPPLKFVSSDGSVLTLMPPTSPPGASIQVQGSYQDNTYRPKCQKSVIPVTVTLNFSGPLPSNLSFTATYCNNAKKLVNGDFAQWSPGQQTVSFAASYTITGNSTYTASNPMPKAPNHPLQSK